MPVKTQHSSGAIRATVSFVMLIGLPVGLVFLAVWQTIVDTSPTLSDEERIRGWETVLRELPATLFLVTVPIVGLGLAVSAGRRGAEASARRAIWLHGAVLFFALLVILNGSAENIMTTRPSTVKWLLLPLQVVMTAFVIQISRRLVVNTATQ